MSDITSTVDTYIAMWNETDPNRRADLIRRAWAESGRYQDPLLEAEGHEGLSEMVAAVHATYPGHQFRRVSAVDAHHQLIRFGWELFAPDGSITVAGIDVGVVDDDSKLVRIAGFFGELSEVAAAA